MSVHERPDVVVIGVGTGMRRDDGFGAAVVAALLEPPGLGGRARLAFCDGEPSRMIDLWDGYRHAIVVDALRGGNQRHGFVYWDELDGSGQRAPSRALRNAGEPPGASHALGLGVAVRLAEVLGRLPGRLTLYAVHGQDFSLGAGLSQPVAAAVPRLAERIRRDVLADPQTARPARAEGPGGHVPGGPGEDRPVRATLAP